MEQPREQPQKRPREPLVTRSFLRSHGQSEPRSNHTDPTPDCATVPQQGSPARLHSHSEVPPTVLLRLQELVGGERGEGGQELRGVTACLDHLVAYPPGLDCPQLTVDLDNISRTAITPSKPGRHSSLTGAGWTYLSAAHLTDSFPNPMIRGSFAGFGRTFCAVSASRMHTPSYPVPRRDGSAHAKTTTSSTFASEWTTLLARWPTRPFRCELERLRSSGGPTWERLIVTVQ